MFLDTVINGKLDSSSQRDSNLKSFAKTVSWRIIGTLDTIIISYLITGNTAMVFSIGSVEVVTKMILYYFHERVWAYAKVKR